MALRTPEGTTTRLSDWAWSSVEIELALGLLTLSVIEDAIDHLGPPVSEMPRVYGHPDALYGFVGAFEGAAIYDRDGATLFGVRYIHRHDMPRGKIIVLVPITDPVDLVEVSDG
jgi:hypothetical protein